MHDPRAVSPVVVDQAPEMRTCIDDVEEDLAAIELDAPKDTAVNAKA